MIHFKPMITALLLTIATAGAQTQQVDYDEQIADLKRKIESTNKKTNEMQESIAQDKRSFDAADSVHRVTLERLIVDKGDLARQQAVARSRADSVSIEIEGLQRQLKNLQASQTHFKAQMAGACDQALTLLRALPPANVHNHISALEFLKGEIAGNAVGNPEAIERFWQILFAVNDMAQSIDVYTAASPVAAIAGEVFFIRLGLAWLGVVDQNGTHAYTWRTDADDAGKQWNAVEDATQVAAMLKCAKIRQGNAVPEIVSLPFAHDLVRESDTGMEDK
jgi:hypothetical protein